MPYDPFQEPETQQVPPPVDPTSLISQLAQVELNPKHLTQLQTLLPTPEQIDIQREIMQQYNLLKSLQSDILNKSQKSFIIDATPTQVSSMLGQINSFLSLYVRSQKDFDLQKELHTLRSAITVAVKDLPDERQEAFFNEMERLTDG